MKHFFCWTFLSLAFSLVSAQALQILPNISVIENGNTLITPFAGGLHAPQFSPIDFNNDGKQDLFAFDRACSCVKTYLNTATMPNSIHYEFAPQYVQAFPKLQDWALLRDYNCDGKMDIFTAKSDSIVVYTNTSTNGNLSFSAMNSILMANNAYIFVATSDIPAIDDIDNDGDMDILAFESQGFYVQYYKNLSKENYNDCQHLEFMIDTHCWGKFKEDGLNNDISLNQNCPGNIVSPISTGIEKSRHSGSTLCTYDQDGNGSKELLVGDISFNNVVYLNNAGTPTNALIDSQDFYFPSYDVAANIYLFPAAYIFDADNDNQEDLIVTPSNVVTSLNTNQLWFYKNNGSNNNHDFYKTSSNFLQSDMIDCGSASRPVFFDYNSDGKLDIVVGNDYYKLTSSTGFSDLTVYENIGTNQQAQYQLVTRQYLGANTLFTNPILIGFHPTFGDLDGDGDSDLVIGESQGKLYVFENIAAPNAPAQFDLLYSEYKNIDVGAMAMPQLFDLDNDGLLDLLIGEQTGIINYYRNIGTATNADFAPIATTEILGGIDVNLVCCLGYSQPFFYRNANNQTELLLGTEYGEVWHYTNIDNNLTGNFTQMSNHFGELHAGYRASICAADINNDGFMDYALGNMLGGVELFTANQNVAIASPLLQAPLNWQLSPNPSQSSEGKIIILETLKENIVFEVFSIEGKKLHSQTIKKEQHEISLPFLTSGIYFVKLSNEKGDLGVKKWVVGL
ncbi:MAG: T9SS type A sorting domain-containing protein [Bacteroidia bacterium]